MMRASRVQEHSGVGGPAWSWKSCPYSWFLGIVLVLVHMPLGKHCCPLIGEEEGMIGLLWPAGSPLWVCTCPKGGFSCCLVRSETYWHQPHPGSFSPCRSEPTSALATLKTWKYACTVPCSPLFTALVFKGSTGLKQTWKNNNLPNYSTGWLQPAQ